MILLNHYYRSKVITYNEVLDYFTSLDYIKETNTIIVENFSHMNCLKDRKSVV